MSCLQIFVLLMEFSDQSYLVLVVCDSVWPILNDVAALPIDHLHHHLRDPKRDHDSQPIPVSMYRAVEGPSSFCRQPPSLQQPTHTTPSIDYLAIIMRVTIDAIATSELPIEFKIWLYKSKSHTAVHLLDVQSATI